jgi:hypothetical protein
VRELDHDTIVVTDGRRWAAARVVPEADRTVVEQVHRDLLPALPRGPYGIAFHHSVDEAVRSLPRRGGVAILLPAPRIEQVRRTVAQARLLPEKATSFQPKPAPGVMVRSLRAE